MQSINPLFTPKVLFRYFRPLAWFVLAGLITLHLVVPEGRPFWNLLTNLTLFFIFIKVSTIIHEFGHIQFAQWAGGIPKRIMLGTGHEIYRGELKGIKIILNSIPMGGSAQAIFPADKQNSWRYAIYYAGGVLLNMTVAGLLILIFGYNELFPFSAQRVDIAGVLIYSNAIAILNLLPFYVTRNGLKIPTDGLALLKLLFTSEYKKSFGLKAELWYEAYEHMENRAYDSAEEIFIQLNRENPDNPMLIYNVSTVCLKKANWGEALKYLDTLENRLHEDSLKSIKGLVYNNLVGLPLEDRFRKGIQL